MKAKIIAGYILNKAKIEEDLISNLKLQKLLYYSQGFHLAVFNAPLFEEKIVNWMHGPVVQEVYNEYKHYGKDAINYPDEFDYDVLESSSRALIDEVYDVYGQFSASALRNLTHSEPPWKDTENNEAISHQSLKKYFTTRIVDDGEEGQGR